MTMRLSTLFLAAQVLSAALAGCDRDPSGGGPAGDAASVSDGGGAADAPAGDAMAEVDRFGVDRLYPGGGSMEAWFLDMDAPESDDRFRPDGDLSQNPDGSWKLQATQVRARVETSAGFDDETTTRDHAEALARGYMFDPRDWRNVEMTGYVKLNDACDSGDEFTWYVRGGSHTGDMDQDRDDTRGCWGVAYKGSLEFDGDAFFVKEQWHVEYTEHRGEVPGATTDLCDRWIGLKLVVYDLPAAEPAVRLELWLDDDADGTGWVRIAELTDEGGWGSEGDACGGAPDQVIAWGGPLAVFRWDDPDDVDIRWWSVREIEPPAP